MFGAAADLNGLRFAGQLTSLELPGIRMGRHLLNPGVSELKVRDLRVVTERPLRVDIDGESAGFTPAAIHIVPHSLLFLVGPDNSNKLHLSK